MLVSEKEKFLKQVYDDYYRRLCFYASRYLSDLDEAKDVVQEMFVKLWERELDFANAYALSAYLYSGVYNACMNRLVTEGIHRKHNQEILRERNRECQADFVTDRIESEVLEAVFRAIDHLPEECRKVFQLSYVEGGKIEEVALVLGISEYTVKSQRARAKKLLKERLKGLYPVVVALFFT